MKKSLIFVIMFFALSILILFGCGSQESTSKSIKSDLIEQEFKSKIKETAQKASTNDYVEGELIVKYKTNAKSSEIQSFNKSLGVTVKKSLGVIGDGMVDLLALPDGLDVKAALLEYMNNSNVSYAEPNYKRYIRTTIPNDTYFVQQWALNNTGQMMGGSVGADIKAPLAWDYSRGSDNLVVAVIDTGIDYNHEDLFGKIWINSGEICNNGKDDDRNGYVDDCFGWNFAKNNNNPMDDHGHGTHCAGVIGATTNNNLGISGILWNVKIMALKFLNSDGSGGTVADVVSALNYAVKMGAKIVNASYGSSTYSQAEYDSIASANEKGVLFIAAAGNDAENNDLSPSYPCNYGLANIISVSASDQNDNIASFSNFGPTKVDVSAPGVYILSLINLNGYLNKYFWDGTSMATPHVVGLAGLVMTQPEYVKYNFSIYQSRAIIETYVDTLPAFIGKIKTGGRINAYKSVTALLSPTNLYGEFFGPTSAEKLRIHLNWKNNATGIDNIRIERMQMGVDADYKEIARLSPNISSYSDFDIAGESTYRYRVRAYKGFKQSYLSVKERDVFTFYTNVIEVTTPKDAGFYGGGDGCSITAHSKNLSKELTVDVFLIMIPLLIILNRFVRRYR